MPKTKLLRYILVGGVSYLLEMAVLYGMHDIAGINSLVSVTVSFWIGFAVAFVLQKYIAFQNNDREKQVIVRQLVLYSLLVGFNYVFTLGVVALLSPYISVLLCRTFAIFVVTLWNFLLYQKIFKPRVAAD